MYALAKPGWHALACCLIFSVVMSAAFAGMCKWVDENGTVHYAERCPEGVDSDSVEIQPPPSEAQVEEAEQRSAEYQRILSSRKSSKTQDIKVRSLTLEELGPLPENTTSNYLVTQATGIILGNDNKGQFNLNLIARESLPSGAYIEAHFPDPENTGQQQIIKKYPVSRGDRFLLLSPKNSGFKCWNYVVEVFIFSDDSKDELLDIHQQTIQCRFDQDLFKGMDEYLDGMVGGGICPSEVQRDLKKMSVEQLDALCESEREKRLKPEREKLIALCIKRGDKQAEWCENYYADWGDAQRISPSLLRPALYYNLPECVAAKEARKQNQ